MAVTPDRPVPALVFLPPDGTTKAERWMSAARRGCAADLLERLRQAGFGPLHLVAADPSGADDLAAPDVERLREDESPFHFGRALVRIIESRGFDSLAYFGGASAPLASTDDLRGWLGRAQQLPSGGALVNNLHSTDWAILGDARRLLEFAERLPTDNPLGWVLREEVGVVVETPPASAAARTDIDTPGDLALVRGHPALGPRLRSAVEKLPDELARRAEALARVVETPAQSVALVGRVSEMAWRDLVQRSQVWVRVFAEERGMRASGRLARGEARSLVAQMVEERGPAAFVAALGDLVGGVFWDTRVWMAHRGPWPGIADRMAADLGWTEEIADPGLRALTEAVVAEAVPIVTGGQGVVAGSLRAFLEVSGTAKRP